MTELFGATVVREVVDAVRSRVADVRSTFDRHVSQSSVDLVPFKMLKTSVVSVLLAASAFQIFIGPEAVAKYYNYFVAEESQR